MLWHVESILQWVDTLKVDGMMSLLKMEAVSDLGQVVHTRCLAEDYRNRDWCCPVASKRLHTSHPTKPSYAPPPTDSARATVFLDFHPSVGMCIRELHRGITTVISGKTAVTVKNFCEIAAVITGMGTALTGMSQ